MERRPALVELFDRTRGLNLVHALPLLHASQRNCRFRDQLNVRRIRHLPQHHLAAASDDHHIAPLGNRLHDLRGRCQDRPVVYYAGPTVRQLLVTLREHQLQVARSQHRINRSAGRRALERPLQEVTQAGPQGVRPLVLLGHLRHRPAQLPRGVNQHGLVDVLKTKFSAQTPRDIARSGAVLARNCHNRHRAPPALTPAPGVIGGSARPEYSNGREEDPRPPRRRPSSNRAATSGAATSPTVPPTAPSHQTPPRESPPGSSAGPTMTRPR